MGSERVFGLGLRIERMVRQVKAKTRNRAKCKVLDMIHTDAVE